jgi:hypothetical protein
VPKEQLNRTKIAGLAVELRRLGASHRIHPI